jgi:hypothetical protein
VGFAKRAGLLLLLGDGGGWRAEAGDARGVRGGGRRGRVGHVPPRRHLFPPPLLPLWLLPSLPPSARSRRRRAGLSRSSWPGRRRRRRRRLRERERRGERGSGRARGEEAFMGARVRPRGRVVVGAPRAR